MTEDFYPLALHEEPKKKIGERGERVSLEFIQAVHKAEGELILADDGWVKA